MIYECLCVVGFVTVIFMMALLSWPVLLMILGIGIFGLVAIPFLFLVTLIWLIANLLGIKEEDLLDDINRSKNKNRSSININSNRINMTSCTNGDESSIIINGKIIKCDYCDRNASNVSNNRNRCGFHS